MFVTKIISGLPGKCAGTCHPTPWSVFNCMPIFVIMRLFLTKLLETDKVTQKTRNCFVFFYFDVFTGLAHCTGSL